jgi:DnaK suppressor protein
VTTSAVKKKSPKAAAKKAVPVRAGKAPAKTPAKAPAQKKPATRPPVVVTGATAEKTPARSAPPSKTSTAKKAPPAAPKTSSGPAAAPTNGKSAGTRMTAKPAPAPVPAAPKPTAPMAGPVTAKAVGAPVAMPPGVVPRKPGRGTPKYFVAPVQAPLPAPTSRFADRFAPPRPPTRQMTKQETDTPRQAHKADPKLANAWKTKSGKDLSDDEVMAMPESEYMNEKQLEFFRVKLQALKDDLLSNAGETTEHLREDTSIVPDPADRATIEEEHALELRTRDRERKLLKKISQSLARIESGEYGFCDETGEPIGLGRLIARPTATLSLEAQQRRELKQKMFGD